MSGSSRYDLVRDTSVAFRSLLRRPVFGVEPADPTVLALTAGALLTVAALASYLARRPAVRIEPRTALAEEYTAPRHRYMHHLAASPPPVPRPPAARSPGGQGRRRRASRAGLRGGLRGRLRAGLRAGLRFLSVLGLVLGPVACAAPAPEAGSDGRAAAALDSVYATFAAAYDSANVQLLMDEVYAPDAFYLPPDSPILSGQDQFRGQFSFLERYARNDRPGPRISFDIVDREISGDVAYDVGVYTLRAPDSPPDAEGSRGKFIVIWKRNRQGEWRIHADGFSAVVGPSARPERDGS